MLHLHLARVLPKVRIVAGELVVNGTSFTLDVGHTWGYDFTWTLRDGPQQIEQHKCVSR